MGRKSRNKGKAGELEVAKLLRSHGFSEARRGVQFSGGPDSPDVVGLPGFHVEVKRTERLSLYSALDQANADAGSDTPVVFHRRSNRPWVVILEAEHFLSLVHSAHMECSAIETITARADILEKDLSSAMRHMGNLQRQCEAKNEVIDKLTAQLEG